MSSKEGIVWKNSDLNALRSRLGARGAGGRSVVQEIMEEAAEYGRDKMVEFIETRGTGWRGHFGRVETGKMDDSVDFKVYPPSGSSQKISVGWVDPAQREDYFKYQEQGFTQPSGHDVPPMHALLDAFIATREKVRRDIQDAIRAGKI